MNCVRHLSPSTGITICLLVAVTALFVRSAVACQGTLLRNGVNAQERVIILEAHNRLRQKVAQGQIPGQPGAQNMQEMIWDDELASRAQQWANECQYRHDPSKYLNRFTMGQNLAIIWSTAALDTDGDFPSRIQLWFNEFSGYQWGQWSQKTGHYSQLVWSDSRLVGCGFSYYKDATKYNKLYVCNYGPGGNIIGNEPYKSGQPSCQNHGMYPSSRYPGLCSGGSDSNDITASINYIPQSVQSYKPISQSTHNSHSSHTLGSLTSFSGNVGSTYDTSIYNPATDYTFKSLFDRIRNDISSGDDQTQTSGWQKPVAATNTRHNQYQWQTDQAASTGNTFAFRWQTHSNNYNYNY